MDASVYQAIEYLGTRTRTDEDWAVIRTAETARRSRRRTLRGLFRDAR